MRGERSTGSNGSVAVALPPLVKSSQTQFKMALAASRFSGARVAARKVAAVRPATRMSVMAFKVTLQTPSGDKTIEVAPDTYILDAAEVGPHVVGIGHQR